MKFNEEVIKRVSCGSLIKKRSCGGRVIRIESLDVNTAERINSRVCASARQNIVESQASMRNADTVFKGPVKVLKIK